MSSGRRSNSKNTGKEAIYGGYEYRNDYEHARKKKSTMLRFALTLFVSLLACSVFFVCSAALFSRMSALIREKVSSDTRSDPEQYDASEIRSPFIATQWSVKFEEVDTEEANIYSIPVGVRIRSVTPHSDEYVVGFREGDIIVKVNDCPITDIGSLYDYYGRCECGELVTYRVFRNNSYEEIVSEVPRR